MNDDMARKLAEAIYHQTVMYNWWFYVLLISITFVGGYCGSFLSAYSRKRGEQLATKADLDDIKSQLRSTTEITEQIRNDIAHEEWRKQQHVTLKRQKLEEYLTYIYTVNEDLSKEMRNNFFYSEESVDVHAGNKATMLMKLYLPELKDEHSMFLIQSSAFKMWMADGMTQQLEKRKQGVLKPTVDSEHMNKYKVLLDGINAAILLVEEKASQLAEELISP